MQVRSLLLSLLLIGYLPSFAQDTAVAPEAVPREAIKVSPLHLLNYYPTIELSYEQRLLPQVTIQLEAGYVLDNNRGGELFQGKRGIKSKLEGRYYFTSAADHDQIHYFAVEVQANVINFDRTRWLKGCFNHECSYLFAREVSYKVKYREQDVSLKWGAIRYLRDHFFLDFNTGLTLRNIHYYEPPLPRQDMGINDAVVVVQIPNEHDRVAVSPNVCLRLGYRLNSKDPFGK